MRNSEENERLKYKICKQQEDIDYLREVIDGLKAELKDSQNKNSNNDERGR